MAATRPARADFTGPRHRIVQVEPGALVDDLNRVTFFAFWPTEQERVPSGVRGQIFVTDLGEWIARHGTGRCSPAAGITAPEIWADQRGRP